MSYENAFTMFIVFFVPACIFIVTKLIHLKRMERLEQADLESIFANHNNDSREITH